MEHAVTYRRADFAAAGEKSNWSVGDLAHERTAAGSPPLHRAELTEACLRTVRDERATYRIGYDFVRIRRHTDPWG